MLRDLLGGEVLLAIMFVAVVAVSACNSAPDNPRDLRFVGEIPVDGHLQVTSDLN